MKILEQQIMTDKLKIYKDVERGGSLLPFEFIDLPFTTKRVFVVTDIPKDSIRGEHAHYETQQIIVCVKGRIIVYLDNGYRVEERVLEEGDFVFVDKMIWDSQKFTTGEDVMLVLCSTHYNVEDYILDRETFYQLINNKTASGK